MINKQVSHAVVVGGSKGLGRLVAERFTERGFTVSTLSRSGGSLDVDLEKLTDAASASILAGQITALGGPIQYLVFCQRYRGDGDIWAGEIQIGLTATKLLIEALVPHFNTGADCAIGVVSSPYAEFVGNTQPAGYHVVKAGLNQMMRYYAVALGAKNIRVNAVMPLTYSKPESRDYYNSKPELAALYEKFVPLKRMGRAEDSVDLLDFLCSEKAAFITGQAIHVDGGTSLICPESLARTFGESR